MVLLNNLDHVQIFTGSMDARGKKFAICASRFNHTLVEKLVEGALFSFQQNGADLKNQSVFWVPGAHEIPAMVKNLSDTGDFDGIVCVGVLIKGATEHFNHVATNCASQIAALAAQAGAPITNGIIASDTLELAQERAGTRAGNFGSAAALAAIELSNAIENFKKRREHL